jgi:Domain of unknown function (DUF4157)
MNNLFYVSLVSSALTIAPTVAWSYDIDLGPLGHACDTYGGGVVGGLPIVGHLLNEADAQAAGAGLEQWIIASRNSAITTALPIPDGIRQRLTGYASEDSMNRVRYVIDNSGWINVAHVIEQAGIATAVTLIDVVVFRGPSEASDPSLWAHELLHVDQYAAWGSHNFAISYVRDYGAIEDPAYAKGNGYWGWAGLAVAPPPPQNIGAFCYIPGGRYGPGPLQPFGAQCFVNGPQGPNLWSNRPLRLRTQS